MDKREGTPRAEPVDRDLAPLCRSCAYDLTGLEAPGTCPECGNRFEELPGDEIVTLAWPCLNCGYPLAGFRRNQKCSECAMPVRISVDPTLMRFQPLEYRNRLRRGALFAGLGLVSVILVPLLVGIVGLWSGSGPATVVALLLGYVLMFALFALGWWRVLSPPPSSLGLTTRQERRVRIARWSLIATVALSVTVMVIEQVAAIVYGSSAMTDLAMILSEGGRVLAFLAFGVFFAFGLLALRPIYKRSRTARKRPGVIATFTLWSGLSVFALLILGMVLVWVSMWLAGPGGGGPATGSGGGIVLSGLIVMAAGLGAIVVFLCYIVSIDGVRTAIGRVNREILLAQKRAVKPAQTGETPVAASPKNDSP
jgi:hypothetical protein